MKLLPNLPLGLCCLLCACASTTGARRLGINAPFYSDVIATGAGETESVDVQGLGLSVQLEARDQIWQVFEVGGRVYDFEKSDLFPRSTEFGVGALRELGALNAKTRPFVDSMLRCSRINEGVGDHVSFDLGGGLRHEIGPQTSLELGLAHSFSICDAAHDRELDGWILRFGLLFGF